MTPIIFVGEKPSVTAHRKGWTWESGRLAAATLFDALSVVGINRHRCGFVNLFGDHPDAPLVASEERLVVLQAAAKAGVAIVALGEKVSAELCEIPHTKIRHPAARGKGRAVALYREHVRDRIGAFK